jgi:hypothetical protein
VDNMMCYEAETKATKALSGPGSMKCTLRRDQPTARTRAPWARVSAMLHPLIFSRHSPQICRSQLDHEGSRTASSSVEPDTSSTSCTT